MRTTMASPLVTKADRVRMAVDFHTRPIRSRDWQATALLSAVVLGLAIALPLVVRPTHVAGLPITLLYVGLLAMVSRFWFQVGSSVTSAAELVFLPALAVLPAPLIPAYVIAAFAINAVIDIAMTGAPASRLVKVPMWSAFSLGPALILSVAGTSNLLDSPALVVAVAASQFVGDALITGALDFAGRRIQWREYLEEVGTVCSMDAALVPVGFVIATAVQPAPWRLILVSPLLLVFRMLARERNARVKEALELSDAYHGTALVLGDIIEHDDTYTGEHSRGVVELSLAVARAMGLSAEQRLKVEFGARLHDVGKVAVPKEIINKPGALDEREWEIIKTHTVEGQRILDRAGGLMREIGVIVRSSHEKWEGGGYPDGLVGTAIPIESRVVSACDAYNAMITDRSYRRAMSVSSAVQELRDHAGSQFDPAVVEALIDVVAELPTPAVATPDAPAEAGGSPAAELPLAA